MPKPLKERRAERSAKRRANPPKQPAGVPGRIRDERERPGVVLAMAGSALAESVMAGGHTDEAIAKMPMTTAPMANGDDSTMPSTWNHRVMPGPSYPIENRILNWSWQEAARNTSGWPSSPQELSARSAALAGKEINRLFRGTK